MIVFDASVIVGAALVPGSVPERALLLAERTESFALSVPIFNEISDVLSRPKFSRVIRPERRSRMLEIIRAQALWFHPIVHVTDCRDAKDNIYLELALAAAAETIISSDSDLLVLDPWRGVRVVRPADYLVRQGGNAPA